MIYGVWAAPPTPIFVQIRGLARFHRCADQRPGPCVRRFASPIATRRLFVIGRRELRQFPWTWLGLITAPLLKNAAAPPVLGRCARWAPRPGAECLSIDLRDGGDNLWFVRLQTLLPSNVFQRVVVDQ